MKFFKKTGNEKIMDKLEERRAVMGSIVNSATEGGFGDPSKMAEIMNAEEYMDRFGFISKKRLKWYIVTMAMSHPDLRPNDLAMFQNLVGFYFMKASVSNEGFMVKETRSIFNQMLGYGQEMQIAEARGGKKKNKDII